MSVDFRAILEKHFSQANLRQLFDQKILFASATGTDGVSARQFADIAGEQIEIIVRKFWARRYEFTRYREKLILKGRGKAPREICIPTVRDKLVLRALNEALSEALPTECHPPPINRTISRIKEAMASGAYTGHLRLDIQDFYPSIRHTVLRNLLLERSLPPEMLDLIERSIRQRSYRVAAEDEMVGIPQGLPISNAMANIYLAHIDLTWGDAQRVLYSRFVDDVLILGAHDQLPDIHEQITHSLRQIGLTAHPLGSGKTELNPIAEPVSYLGYRLSPNQTSVRSASLHKLKESLIAIVVRHTRQKKKGYRAQLLWRINLRVTGCIVNRERFGWLHFFSEIDDISMLKALDIFVGGLIKRWKLRGFKPKKFVRAYYEIRYRAATSKYVPSFDGYEKSEMVTVLRNVFGVHVTSQWTEIEISREFYSRIRRETVALEEDLVRLS